MMSEGSRNAQPLLDVRIEAGARTSRGPSINRRRPQNTGSPADTCHRARRQRDPMAVDNDREVLRAWRTGKPTSSA